MKNHISIYSVFLQKLFLRSFLFLLCVSQGYIIKAQCFDTAIFLDPGEYSFDIPTESSNYIIELDIRGGDGGDFLWGTNPPSSGGQGAVLKASFFVPGGSELQLFVGEAGKNGIGTGAGGGGGATGVMINNSEVLIAAGAGGGAGLLSIGNGGLVNTDSPAEGGQGAVGAGGGGFGFSGAMGMGSTGGGAGSVFGISVGGSGSQDAGTGGIGFGGGGGGSNESGGGGGGYKGGDGGDIGEYEGSGGDSYVNEQYSGSVISTIIGEDGQGSNMNGYISISCVPVTLVELELSAFDHPLCFDGFDGMIEVTASSGLAPYLYSLNGGLFGSENVFVNLSSGDYVISVMDALGNTATVNITLDNPEPLINTFIESTDNICFGGFDGTIEMLGSGGTAMNGYTYSLNGSAGQSSGVFTGLSNGFYVIEVIDDNLCSTQITANITSPPDLLVTVTNIQGESCPSANDGGASVFAMGGVPDYTYALDTFDFDVFDSFDGLTPGLHTISVMDANGCIETASFNVEEVNEIVIIADVEDLFCSGYSTGEIVVNVSGGNSGYLYSFEGQEPDSLGIYQGLIAGVYNILVSDQNGCTASTDIEINEPLPLELVVESNISASCGGNGQVVLDLVDVEGEVLYSVDGVVGSSDTFDLPAGIYTGSACDSVGCAATVQFEILQLSDISIDLLSKSDVSCFDLNDGSISVVSSGGQGDIVYNIDGEPDSEFSIFDSLYAGNYIITAKDSLGCTASILVIIEEPEALTLQPISVVDVDCFGDNTGGVDFIIKGGVSPYQISSNTGIINQDSSFVTINDLAGGDLIVSLIDSLGCIVMDTVSVGENNPIQISIDSVASVNCAEGTKGYVSLSATGGRPSYSFYQDDISTEGIFVGLKSDNYKFSVVDSLDCIAEQEVEIGMVGALIIEGTGSSNVSCAGGSDGLFVLNIPNYIDGIDWRIDGILNPDSSFMDLAAGQYTLTATDSFLCSVEVEIEINEPNELVGEIIYFAGGDGLNGELTVIAEGGTEPYMYSIDDMVTFQDTGYFVGLVEGDYIINIVDANGCEAHVDQSLVDAIDPVLGAITVSPNPAHHTLVVDVVDVQNRMNPIDGALYDIQGRILKFFEMNLNEKSSSIDISDLKKGTYFLKMKTGVDVSVKRIIKI